MMKRLFAAIVFVVAAAGWNQFLFRPVTYFLDGHTASVTGVELLKPANAIYPGDWLRGGLLIACTLLLGLVALFGVAKIVAATMRYIERSEVGISILEMKVNVTMMAADKTKAEISREQTFHANRRGVGAYRFTHLSESGSVQESDCTTNTRIDGENFTLGVHRRRRGNEIEVVEVFKRELPVSTIATYLPDNVVLWLFETFSLLDKKIAVRTGSTKNIDEYALPTPIYQLTAINQPISNLNLEISFFDSGAPTSANVRCLVLRDNAVSYRTPDRRDQGGRVLYSVYLKRLLAGERLRFEWDN